MYQKAILGQPETPKIIIGPIDQMNTRIIQNANLSARQMDLKERAKLARAIYPELSNLLTVITLEHMDNHRPSLAQARYLVQRYESFPAMIGEAFMAIFLEGIEEELR